MIELVHEKFESNVIEIYNFIASGKHILRIDLKVLNIVGAIKSWKLGIYFAILNFKMFEYLYFAIQLLR